MKASKPTQPVIARELGINLSAVKKYYRDFPELKNLTSLDEIKNWFQINRSGFSPSNTDEPQEAMSVLRRRKLEADLDKREKESEKLAIEIERTKKNLIPIAEIEDIMPKLINTIFAAIYSYDAGARLANKPPEMINAQWIDFVNDISEKVKEQSVKWIERQK